MIPLGNLIEKRRDIEAQIAGLDKGDIASLFAALLVGVCEDNGKEANPCDLWDVIMGVLR